jgi:uncharacterized membrane protein YfcA
MLELQYLWLFLMLVGLGAFSQGFTGLGFGIIILAGIAFTPWNFERSTVVVNLMVLVLNLSIIFMSYRKAKIQWRLAGILLIGMILGVPLGYGFIITYGNQPIFRLIFGATLVLFAANELIRPRLKGNLSKKYGFPAGLLGGFLNGAFTAAGPPIALFVYSQSREPASLKGTLQVVFAASNIWRLLNIVLLGEGLTRPVLQITLYALPVVILFTFLGHLASKFFSKQVFMRAVYCLVAAAGVMNLAKGL